MLRHHYSGIGKSTTVARFVEERRAFCARGKYSKMQSAATPFSAITDALGQLAAGLAKPQHGELLHSIRRELEGSDARSVMTNTFPCTAPLFMPSAAASREPSPVTANMTQVKEAFKVFMNGVCTRLPTPLILFLDDGQWIDELSLELLKDTLSTSSINNILVICTYRSNEVKEDHPFYQLMKEVEKAVTSSERKSASRIICGRMELYGLPPDDIGEFIADTLDMGGAEEVSDLTEVVYEKTLGNPFYVKQSMEELERKNAVFYDMMIFAWSYNITKVKMENYLSDDVADMVKSKIEGLPKEVRTMATIMSLLPNAVSLTTVVILLDGEGVDTSKVEKLLGCAVKQGILSQQADGDGKQYAFAHEKIREASYAMIPEGRSRDQLLVRISNVLVELGDEGDRCWALFAAVDHLNSVAPALVPRMQLARLNFRVGKLNLDKGAAAGANANFLAGLACLAASGSMWTDYDFTLELLDAVMTSEWGMDHHDQALEHSSDVLRNAKSLEDKSTAYLYRMKGFGVNAAGDDGRQAVREGLEICKIYGLKFPYPAKKPHLLKESAQLKAALRGRPLTALSKLPPTRDAAPFERLRALQGYARAACDGDLEALLVHRAVRLALKGGISVALVAILATHASALPSSKVGTAKKYALAAEKMLEEFREDKCLYAETRLLFDQLDFM